MPDGWTFAGLAPERVALVGLRGAGKTTLLDVLCGKTKPDSGHAVFGPMELTRLSEDEIVAAGVGRKFQTPSVFAQL